MQRRSSICFVPDYHFGHPALSRTFQPFLERKYAPLRQRSRPSEKKIENGVRAISEDRQGPLTAITFAVEAGAKFDPITAPGLSHAMQFAIPTSNLDASMFQIDRTMRALGVGYSHSEVRKQFLCWHLICRRDSWKPSFQQLCACLSAPRFHEADIERYRDTWDNMAEEQRYQQPMDHAIEQLESVAFFKEPLGAPRMVPPQHNDAANSSTLVEHWATYFQPPRIRIGGMNVDVEELTAQYQLQLFPHTTASPHHQRSHAPRLLDVRNEKAQFHPGREYLFFERRAKEMGTKPNMEEEVILALGWPSRGREEGVAAFAVASVAHEALTTRIAGATSFEDEAAQTGARVFYRPYASTGLEGVVVRGNEAEVPQLLQTCYSKLSLSISDKTLRMAKARAWTKFFADELETTRDYATFLATSSFGVSEFDAALQEVKLDDVNQLLESMRSVPPCLYGTGVTFTVPSLKQMTLA